MSFAYGPFTDVIGFKLTTTSDGAGGLVLSCPKYGSLTVTASNLTIPIIKELVRRLEQGDDFVTNWRNLSLQLGLGDPGVGTPAT